MVDIPRFIQIGLADGFFKWHKLDSETDIMRVVGGWVLRTRILAAWGVTVEQTLIPDTRE
jgi:hypothetical protein